jgi:predicted porin
VRLTKAAKLGAGLALALPSLAQAADLPANGATPAPASPTSCFSSLQDYLLASAQQCPLTYLGVTVYGTIDVGAGYSSHGANLNGAFPQGVQELIAKFSQGSKYQLVPNGLSRSNIGLRGDEPFAQGWSFIFNVNTDFDPYSLRLANGPQSLVENNNKTIGNQSANGDSSRAGQWDNTQGYVGVSNPVYGALTVGRQNSLTADAVTKYDPMAGSYAFSLIGNSATYVSGVGDTETTRYNTSVKYQVNVDQFRASAVWQFGGYGQGNGSNGAAQVGVGGDFGPLSVDAIFSAAQDAVSLSTYSADPLPKGVSQDDLKATLANIDGVVLGAKYRSGPIQAFAGYEYARFSDPSNSYPHGFGTIGGFTVLPGAVNATAYVNNKILQVFWIGAKYNIGDNIDLVGAWYHGWQNDYAASGTNCGPNVKPAVPGASPQGAANPACAGTIDALSALIDYRPIRRLDLYAGVMYSIVAGGIASGYIHSANIAPTIGARLTF